MRTYTPRPPQALHVMYRRIYGDSAYMRSTNRKRLRLCAKFQGTPMTADTPAAAPTAEREAFEDQTILHAEGETGNCLQATLASVLARPISAIPHFALLGEEHWWDCLQAWLDAEGYWIDYKPDSYAAEGGQVLPRCWLSGPSPRGFSHAVVGDTATGEMLHDPHPSRAGLLSVEYRIHVFKKPAALSAPVAAPPADPLLGQALAALVRYANACDADAKTVAVIQALEARIDAAPPAASGVEWVERAMELAEELETAAILYGASEPESDEERDCRERRLAARDSLRTHLSTALTGAAKE